MHWMNNSKALLLHAAVLAGLLCLSAPNLRAQDTGEALFKSKCAMCHGPDADGKTKMGEMLKVPDLRSAEVQKQTDAALTQAITKGKNKMPGYEGKLSKEQIAKLVAYVREVGKKR